MVLFGGLWCLKKPDCEGGGMGEGGDSVRSVYNPLSSEAGKAFLFIWGGRGEV